MSATHAGHWRILLVGISVLAAVTIMVDLAQHAWVHALSSFCLLIGAVAFERSLRYHSVRWRTIAWIAFVMAVVAQAVRLALA